MSDLDNDLPKLPRRDFLGRTVRTILAGSFAGVVLPGCDGEKLESTGEPASARLSSVPLRVSLLGESSDAEAIRRGWSAVSEQAIELTHAVLDRAKPIDVPSFLDAAKRTDVIIYPMAMVGEASSGEAVIGFSESDVQSIEAEAGLLLVAIRNSSRFAGKQNAIPVGARMPAIVSTAETKPLADWKEYDRWVKDDLDGQAAEPLAPGWAGMMFLWRAAAAIRGTWLFGRENLEPLIAEDNYIEVLQQMKQTADRYTSGHSYPKEIWNRLADGELKAAIGFPDARQIESLSISHLPGDEPTSRVLLDMYTPVVSISSGCRQSAVAKQFITWICGGDGSESLRKQVPSLTITRSPRSNAPSNPSTGQRGGYDEWLRERLETTMTLPMIQLDRAFGYYHQLDRQVTRCLNGEASAMDSLREASRRWQDITQSVGIEQQMRQWRRCQGMRA